MQLARGLKQLDSRKEVAIEAVTVDVSNLWRLQAQRGVFLYCDYNWEIDYPMDRIVFPYTGYPAYPHSSEIYPKDKSALELQLDQCFDLIDRTFGNQDMIQMIEQLKAKGRNASLNHMEAFESGIYAPAFVDPSGLAPLASWAGARDAAWTIYPDEHFHDIRGQVERIRLDGSDPTSLARNLGFGVKQILDCKPQSRGRLVEWVAEGGLGSLSAEHLSDLFRDAWNGMRLLPYTNAQIAAAFATIASLVATGFNTTPDRANDQASFAAAVGADGLYVEFAYPDNSSSRGYATLGSLRGAMRRELKPLLVPEFQERVAEVKTMLQLVQNPTVLFEFDAFVDLFARQLIPSQVVLGRSPTLFNPALLSIFGLP